MPFRKFEYKSKGARQKTPDITVEINFPDSAVTDQWRPEQIRAAREFLKQVESSLKSLSITIGTRQ